MSSAITSVKIRMYNTGSVGDCLLLLFMEDKKIAFKMMIDCGGWNTTAANVTPCVEDIRSTCEGVIDVLVVTHQHEDHVSGFNQARSVFDQIAVKAVWMSWIENPEDAVGKILKEKYGKKLKELRRSITAGLVKLNAMRGSEKRMNDVLKAKREKMIQALAILEFEEGNSYGKSLAAGKRTNDDAMKYVKDKVNQEVTYLRPGRVLKDIAGLDGIAFFVLGPPRDKDMRYFRIDIEDDEMYHMALKADDGLIEEEEEVMEADAIFVNDIALEDSISPFRDEYKLSGKEETEFNKMYQGKNMRWRQIETDWLESDAGIALRVNNLTNNTSLAMAIGLPNDKVILLPGDAQSGNWLGWHKSDVKKKLKVRGGKDTDELLRDTVFYKVGHHGSHNGTASKSGLEKMKSENLVAMMPLVQDKIPSAWGGADNFPAGALYNALIAKTQGRIIRTDEGMITKASAVARRNALGADKLKEFTTAFKKKEHYVEFTIACKGGD